VPDSWAHFLRREDFNWADEEFPDDYTTYNCTTSVVASQEEEDTQDSTETCSNTFEASQQQEERMEADPLAYFSKREEFEWAGEEFPAGSAVCAANPTNADETMGYGGVSTWDAEEPAQPNRETTVGGKFLSPEYSTPRNNDS